MDGLIITAATASALFLVDPAGWIILFAAYLFARNSGNIGIAIGLSLAIWAVSFWTVSNYAQRLGEPAPYDVLPVEAFVYGLKFALGWWVGRWLLQRERMRDKSVLEEARTDG